MLYNLHLPQGVNFFGNVWFLFALVFQFLVDLQTITSTMLTKNLHSFYNLGIVWNFLFCIFDEKWKLCQERKKTHTQTCMRTSETLFVALENWLYRCKAFFNLYTVPPPPSSCQLERSTITETKPTKARKKSKLFTKKSHWLAVWLTRVELRAWIVDEDGWMDVRMYFALFMWWYMGCMRTRVMGERWVVGGGVLQSSEMTSCVWNC